MNQKEKKFIATVWQHYKDYGRHNLPWRQRKDPYRILVSEIMLQQTQVERVIPKYQAFIATWSTVDDLAQASLKAVLQAWQGLGYNRRAQLLHRCAQVIHATHAGVFPSDYSDLLALPGVGPYTAGAVSAFAYNQPVPILETNIKTALMYHFFATDDEVEDKQLMRLAERTLDQQNPRQWYWALMDYGSYLKRTQGNNIAQSKSYKKQSPFKDSDRQIRGAIIRLLSTGTLSRLKILRALSHFSDLRVDVQLTALLAEGLVEQKKRSYALPD